MKAVSGKRPASLVEAKERGARLRARDASDFAAKVEAETKRVHRALEAMEDRDRERPPCSNCGREHCLINDRNKRRETRDLMRVLTMAGLHARVQSRRRGTSSLMALAAMVAGIDVGRFR